MSIDEGGRPAPDRQDPERPTVYRAYKVDAKGRIASPAILIEASGDEEAIARAEALADGRSVEVWDRARCVASVPAKRHGGDEGHG